MILKKILTLEQELARRQDKARHAQAVAAERKAKFDAWMAKYWPQVVAIPTSARIMLSVNRPHQQRGVPQQRSHQTVMPKRLRRGKAIYPAWPGYTADRQKKTVMSGKVPYIFVPLHREKVVGKAPPRGANQRLAQAGQATVEAAILLSVVAIMLLGVVFFGQQVLAFFQHIIQAVGGVL